MTAEGKSLAVPKDSIEERKRGPSAMPADVAAKLSKKELRDLIEFLASLKTAPRPSQDSRKVKGGPARPPRRACCVTSSFPASRRPPASCRRLCPASFFAAGFSSPLVVIGLVLHVFAHLFATAAGCAGESVPLYGIGPSSLGFTTAGEGRGQQHPGDSQARSTHRLCSPIPNKKRSVFRRSMARHEQQRMSSARMSFAELDPLGIACRRLGAAWSLSEPAIEIESIGIRAQRLLAVASTDRPPVLKRDRVLDKPHRPVGEADVDAAGMVRARRDRVHVRAPAPGRRSETGAAACRPDSRSGR